MPAVRSFTVFRDASSPKHSKRKSTKTPSPGPSAIAPPTIALEKENVHPLTGERASVVNAGKKRKTNALAPKQLPLGIKKQKQKDSVTLEEIKPEAKKRKVLSTKTKGAATRKGKKVSRRVSPLPKVEEEVDAETVAQAEIDSKCYELTVLPLADVTTAYDETAATDAHSSLKDKETAPEPEAQDYFSPSFTSASPSTSKLASTSATTHVVSTPERKINAAFTFSSPSPTSARFSKVKADVALARSRSSSPTPSLKAGATKPSIAEPAST